MKLRNLVTAVALALTTLVVGSPPPAGAVPATIPFQGRLTDASGTPLNGSFSIRFSLWTLASGGVEVWNETQPTVTVTNGLFNVDLGSVTALTPGILSGADRFLEIKVGTDAAMTPRQHLGATAYAFRTGDAAGIAAAHSTSPVGNVAAGATVNTCSQTVTFPTAGVAIVSTWVSWETDNGASVTSQSQMGISETSGGFDGQTEYFAILTTNSSGGGYTADVTPLVRFYNVTAGTHTYYTVVNHQVGAFFHHGTYMTVQFFPTAIGTITPAPAEGPSALKRDRSVPESRADIEAKSK